MSKTYYELLDIPRDAGAGEIKRSFRREIAKYHPDKVLHLGPEFQHIAIERAEELTRAYKTLGDPEARAEYDATLGLPSSGGSQSSQTGPVADSNAGSPPSAEPLGWTNANEEPARTGASFAEERAGVLGLIQRATVTRFRRALEGEFGRFEEPALEGFDIVCVPKAAFWTLRLPSRVLGRQVEQVDAVSVAETWSHAAKMKKDPQRDLCVFLMGQALAPASELAQAIAEQRKKPMLAGGKLVLVPVNTVNWHAHVPTDAPPVVKSLLTRLRGL